MQGPSIVSQSLQFLLEWEKVRECADDLWCPVAGSGSPKPTIYWHVITEDMIPSSAAKQTGSGWAPIERIDFHFFCFPPPGISKWFGPFLFCFVFLFWRWLLNRDRDLSEIVFFFCALHRFLMGMFAVFSLSLYSLRQSLEAIGRFNRKKMLLRFPLVACRKDSLGAVSVKILSNHRLFCLHV